MSPVSTPHLTAPLGAARPLTFGRRLAISFAVWTVPAVLSTVETWIMLGLIGRPAPIWRSAIPAFVGWYAWALLTPVVLLVAERARLSRPLRWGAVGAHTLAMLAASVMHAVAYTIAMRLTEDVTGTTFVAHATRLFVGWFPVDLLVYVGIVVVGYAIAYARAARERERLAAHLAAELSQAQLHALRAQLHPHFLFNTLHTIGALVRASDATGALRVLSLLSDVLRRMLRGDSSHEVPLRDEVALATAYLEIEEVRFQDRLRVEWSVPADVSDAAVPALLLQPIVENAIRHGIARRSAAGRIRVAARRDAGSLVVTVIDDGPGLAPGWDREPSPGVGVANTRARLAYLYGAGGQLDLGPAPGGNGGTLVTVRLPFRTMGAVRHPAPPVPDEAQPVLDDAHD